MDNQRIKEMCVVGNEERWFACKLNHSQKLHNNVIIILYSMAYTAQLVHTKHCVFVCCLPMCRS